MRLVTYGEPGRERPGLLLDGGILDVADSLSALRLPHQAPTMRSFLELAEWRQVAARLAQERPGELRASSTVRVGPPVGEPGKVLLAGANTRSHLAEARPLTNATPPQRPMILGKAITAVCGPFDDIIRPPETTKLDYEVELGVVIGRRCRRVPVDRAWSVVAGLTVTNDVSARDVQLAEYESNAFYRTHYLGKSFDTFCPSGPCLVTLDELPTVETIQLRTWVNGVLRQDDTVADLFFSIPELIASITAVMTLVPGDLICTGSPAGVGFFMDPPGFLNVGDVVECEATGIGRLRNTVVAEALVQPDLVQSPGAIGQGRRSP